MLNDTFLLNNQAQLPKKPSELLNTDDLFNFGVDSILYYIIKLTLNFYFKSKHGFLLRRKGDPLNIFIFNMSTTLAL